MSPALPQGEDAPADGLLPPTAGADALSRRFGVYVHVPFCRVRCGYCDFNTYTASELGEGATTTSYPDTVIAELALAERVLRDSEVAARPVSTVFFGGGTPTLLDASDLVRVLAAAADQWGLSPGAEITVEANPDSVTKTSLQQLADGGFTRISFGMQSAVTSVLATLDRTHEPAQVGRAVQWAREAGLRTSLDLIYGAPGESLSDWRQTVQSALDLGVNHISAYALVIEPGTKMGAAVRRGVHPDVDLDLQADMYELADELLAAAGFEWYEVSNWARGGETCAHNLAYWQGHDWWGAGPGAHSHVGGVRWWNVKHPRVYAQMFSNGNSPAVGREVLDEASVQLERAMLQIRLRSGLELNQLSKPARQHIAGMINDALVEAAPALDRQHPRAVLTRRGRLLADAVVRSLTSD